MKKLSVASVKRRLALTRDCGLCRACCTTMKVDLGDRLPRPLTPKEAENIETNGVGSGRITRIKPHDMPCPFLAKDPNSKGCTVYADRPKVCREWMCEWRAGTDILKGEERPDRLGIVFSTIIRGEIPFSFLLAVAAEPTDADASFVRAHNVIMRLASRGHLVICETPQGKIDMYGPEMKVKTYQEKMNLTITTATVTASGSSQRTES